MLISDYDDAFLYNFRPVQVYFSSYETGKSVTGGKGESPEKTNLHTHKQNFRARIYFSFAITFAILDFFSPFS